MERSRIFVSGFPDGTTKSELTVYFQSKRSSGGGDVERIDFDEGRAIVTFEDVEGISLDLFQVQCRVSVCKTTLIISVFLFSMNRYHFFLISSEYCVLTKFIWSGIIKIPYQNRNQNVPYGGKLIEVTLLTRWFPSNRVTVFWVSLHMYSAQTDKPA